MFRKIYLALVVNRFGSNSSYLDYLEKYRRITASVIRCSYGSRSIAPALK